MTDGVCPKCKEPTRAINVTWCSEAVSAYGGWQYYCKKCDANWTSEDGSSFFDKQKLEEIYIKNMKLKGHCWVDGRRICVRPDEVKICWEDNFFKKACPELAEQFAKRIKH